MASFRPRKLKHCLNIPMTKTFATHLQCSKTGEHLAIDQPHGLSPEGWPLLVRYDLERLGQSVSKQDIAASGEDGFWRYASFLPVTQP